MERWGREGGCWNKSDFPLTPLWFFCGIEPREELKGQDRRFKSVSDSLFVNSQPPPAAPRAANIIKEFGCEDAVLWALVCRVLRGFGCLLLPVAAAAAHCCCCCQSALQNQVAADGPRRR